LSDAVSGIRLASEEIGMPESIQGNFQGTAAAFEESTKNMGILLVIAMVVVYIILGILYESFIHPPDHPVGPAQRRGGRIADPGGPRICCSWRRSPIRTCR